MVISDRYQFAFVHVPKCAGMSVREAVSDTGRLDSTNFYWGVAPHRVLGLLDYAHIPLFVLEEHFREIFEKIERYRTLALVRDPFQRFPSSVSQRVQAYGPRRLGDLTADQIDAEVARVIEYLSARGSVQALLPADYIHFQRQADFLYLNGRQLVDTVFPVSKVGQLLDEIDRLIGLDRPQGRSAALPTVNRAVVSRNATLRRLLGIGRPAAGLIKTVLPRAVEESLRSFFFVPRDLRWNSVFEQPYVRDFVRDYYAPDIETFERFR